MERSVNVYTEGSLSKHFVTMMIPLILGNILQQLYNTVDAFILGRYAGSEDFAAVGIASSVMNLLLFAIVGFCTGLSILFAQHYGAGKLSLFRNLHFISVVSGIMVMLGISLLGFLTMRSILVLLKTPEELMSYTLSYLHTIVLGLTISYLYNLYAAMLRAIGKSNIALVALFLAILLNTVLDLLFVGGYHMGIFGAALATIIAQFISAGFCIIYILCQQRRLCFRFEDRFLEKSSLKRMYLIGGVTCIHQVSLYMGKLFIQGAINQEGIEMISAFTATSRIEGFANSFGDSGSAVTSVLVAQNLGAGKRDRVKETFYLSLRMLFVLGIISSFIMFLFAPQLSKFLLGSGETSLSQAISYLRVISIFYVFCFTGNTFAGFYEGIGRVNIPFIGALSHMTLRVLLSYHWIPLMGLKGLSIATGIGWVLVNLGWGITLKVAFVRWFTDK